MNQGRESNADNDRRPGHGRHAERVRPQPPVHGARRAAADHGRAGAAHRHQAAARPFGEIGRLHGRRLRPRHRASRGLHGPGDRRAQPRRRPAGRPSRPLSRHRHDRRPRSANQVSRRLPGGRRPPRFRAGDETQRHRRRGGALSRHDPPGVPRRHLGHARSRAPAVPRKRGPDRRRAGRHGGAVRTAFLPGAAVSPRAGGERDQGCAGPAGSGAAAGHRRRRRSARIGGGRRTGRPGGTAEHPGRHLPERQGRHPRFPPPVGRSGGHLFAGERQPGGQPGGPGLLRRHQRGRHDHPLLAGSAAGNAGDPDRHRAGDHRPQLPPAGRGSGGRKGGPDADAGAGGPPLGGAADRLGRARRGNRRRVARQVRRICWNRTPSRCVPSGYAGS